MKIFMYNGTHRLGLLKCSPVPFSNNDTNVNVKIVQRQQIPSMGFVCGFSLQVSKSVEIHLRVFFFLAKCGLGCTSRPARISPLLPSIFVPGPLFSLVTS